MNKATLLIKLQFW